MSLDALNRLMADAHLSDLPGLIEQALRVDDDVHAVFELLDRLRDSRPMQRCLAVLQTDPEAMALIRRRELLPRLSFAELLAKPKGSLGHTYGALLQALGYDPDFYVGPEAFNNLATDADYVNYRSLATHDLHHVLTGFNFGFSGEMGVLSVSMAQMGAPGFAFIGLVTLLSTWLSAETHYSQITDDRERINAVRYKLELIQRGLAMGDAAMPLFALDWPALLDRDLEELRRELRVEPVREGLPSWCARPELMAALA